MAPCPTTPAPSFTTVRVEVDDRIGRRSTSTQPDKLNPLGTVPLREIAEAARWFDTDVGVDRDRDR